MCLNPTLLLFGVFGDTTLMMFGVLGDILVVGVCCCRWYPWRRYWQCYALLHIRWIYCICIL